MLSFLYDIDPVLLAFFAGLFCFTLTGLGASVVYFFKYINKFVMNATLAISAGIMMSASFFSLLNPAIEMASKFNLNFFLTIVGGFVTGSLLVYIGNRFFDNLKVEKDFNLKRCVLLFSSITIHNIPEGMAIGVAFGSILHGGNLVGALALTLGIAIQNFPEGSSISLPLRREGVSRFKSFLFGLLSGLVEPIFAVIGALLVYKIYSLLSFVLAFAAGAMIFVTIFELIPESQSSKRRDLMALFFIIGFSLMMILDVLLG